MPRYRFSWDNFDDDTVVALASACGFKAEAGTTARDWLAANVKRPHDDFVRATKSALETTWLTRHPRTARAIVERLLAEGIGPRVEPTTNEGYVDYIRRCRNAKVVRWLLQQALIGFGDRDRDPDPDDQDDPLGVHIPRLATLIPAKLTPDGLKPHPYQKEAWQALGSAWAQSQSTGSLKGLLVMPTGSGKTFTAVRWLTQKHLNAGGRVVWIAHRHYLLEQAANAFHQAAFLAPNLPKMRVRIVSGIHHTPSTIGPDDDVVIWSIQSLSRRRDLAEPLLSDPNVFLVVDEAHHAPAETYKWLFEVLQCRDHQAVLGLTATPTRTIEGERPLLSRLFDNRKIHEVEVRSLVERGYLARPMPEVVKTRVAAEEGITEKDRRHLERFSDLSEEWQDRLARLVPRNEVITRRYLDNRERYGKTLVFAINVPHAKLLRDRLRAEGVRAEYIASYRPDNEAVVNADIVERFRDPNGDLDVLINVEILTEGVDIPCVQTVFLTRPTASEILLRQMIGRGLRGPLVKNGTKLAYLVSFEDHWSEFTEWEHPFELVPDIVGCAPEPEVGEETPVPDAEQLVESLPWDLIQATAEAMRRQGYQFFAEAFEAVPHGWYVIERDDEGVEVRQIVPVYAHQRSCWQALIRSLWERANPQSFSFVVSSYASAADESQATPTAAELYPEYFEDCDVPRPSQHSVGQVLEHFLAGGAEPEYHEFAARSGADPYEIADEIIRRDLSELAKSQLITERYDSRLAKTVYPTLREFDAAINDALFERRHPQEASRHPKAVVVFEPLPNALLSPGPAHDLHSIMEQVRTDGAPLLNVPEIAFDGPVEWTARVLSGWYGMAHWEPGSKPGTGRIRVNRLLDSPDVSPTTIAFLLWHEYLHLYLQDFHTPRFRELERRWPGYIAADRELDTLNERFGINYW